MKTDNQQAQAERILRDNFLHQSVCTPNEAWHQNTMRQVRAEALPEIIPYSWIERTTWRVAAAVVMIALITGITNVLPTSSKSDLKWDIAMSKTTCEWLFASTE